MPSASRRRLIGGIDHLGQKQKSGAVIVNAEGVAFSKAACFTSLDGVSFADVGWFVHAAHAAAVRTISGTVHVKGAIATSGTSPIPLTLPAEFRPASLMFVPVDRAPPPTGGCRSSPPVL
jgi:hypothetical protein